MEGDNKEAATTQSQPDTNCMISKNEKRKIQHCKENFGTNGISTYNTETVHLIEDLASEVTLHSLTETYNWTN